MRAVRIETAGVVRVVVEVDPPEQTFDVTAANAKAHAEWIRTYRRLMQFTLVLLALLEGGALVVLSGLTPIRPHIPPDGPTIIASMFVIVAAVVGLLAYATCWMYRPGASAVAVDGEGFTLEFARGRDVRVQWSAPGVSVRISSMGPAGYVDPIRGFTQAAIQGLRYPHFELTEAALSAIVASARAHNLKVTESMVPMLGDQVWGRIWIKDPRRS